MRMLGEIRFILSILLVYLVYDIFDAVFGVIYKITGGWSPDQSTVDFSAGLGDTLLFGFGDDLREFAGVDGGVNKCPDSYRYGGSASFTVGGARLAYAEIAKGGSILIRSAPIAVNFRQGLKVAFHGGFSPIFAEKLMTV